MFIGKVERQIGPKSLGHVQRVTQKVENCKFIQVGETVEHGKVTFREIIEKGHDYFKRTFSSFNKQGEPIKGSEFSEEIIGPEANKKQVRHFGLYV